MTLRFFRGIDSNLRALLLRGGGLDGADDELELLQSQIAIRHRTEVAPGVSGTDETPFADEEIAISDNGAAMRLSRT